MQINTANSLGPAEGDAESETAAPLSWDGSSNFDYMVELIGAYSNSENLARLNRIAEMAKRSPRSVPAERKPVKRRSRQGEILATIKQVLGEHPDGLQTVEARRLVEARLGRELPRSTVKATLAEHASFDRIGHGRYRLLP